MRELDDVEDAEEQGEADRHQPVHDPEHEAVDQVLEGYFHAVLVPITVFAVCGSEFRQAGETRT